MLAGGMASMRASVDTARTVTGAAIENTKTMATASTDFKTAKLSEIEILNDDDIRKQTLKSFKMGSSMTTKGLTKVKQMTLDIAGACLFPVKRGFACSALRGWFVVRIC